MGRGRKSDKLEEEKKVKELIQAGYYEDKKGVIDSLPPADKVRERLEERLNIADRGERLMLTEEIGECKIFIEISREAEKPDPNFIVWKFIKNNEGTVVRAPSHDDIARSFLGLRKGVQT